MSRHFASLPLVVLALLSLGIADVHAQQGRGGRDQQHDDRGNRDAPRDDGRGQQGDLAESRRGSPRDDGLSDSVRRVERSTRGQVLSAERMQSDGRDLNRIKIKDDRGRVRVYMDDPLQPMPRSRNDDN